MEEDETEAQTARREMEARLQKQQRKKRTSIYRGQKQE